MKYFFYVGLIGFFSTSLLAEEREVPLKITADFCNELKASETLSEENEVKAEDQSEEATIPSDFDEDKVQIKYPKAITIPIKLDPKSFFGLDLEETEKNHQKIKENLQQIKQTEEGIDADLTKIEDKNEESKLLFARLKSKLRCKPKNLDAVMDLVEKSLDTFETIAELFKDLPEKFDSRSSLLGENLEILYLQLTAYEEDEMVINENLKLREENIELSEESLDDLGIVTDLFYEGRGNLRRLQKLLLFKAYIFGEELDPLLGKFETLNQTFSSLEKNFKQTGFFEEATSPETEPNSETQKEILEDIKNQLADLHQNKENLIEHSETGELEYSEGKIYLHGHPLYEKEKVIKEACRKLLS